MKIEEPIITQKMRADSYKLLSDCYYCPDEDLIQRLKSLDGLSDDLYSQISENCPDTTQLDELKIDFSKLFVGPFKLLAAPYGSVYLEGKRMIMLDSTSDVKKRYREAGLDLVIKEVPDHITCELEFMYFLICKEAEAAETGDDNARAFLRDQQISFLHTHLAAWVPEFTDNILEHAQTDFYKKLAQITKTFIEKDLTTIADECSSSGA